jgi:hypothetical protein
MHQCQEILGEARGAEVCKMVEAATDRPCPCKAGLACPLTTGVLRIPAVAATPVRVERARPPQTRLRYVG